MRPASLPGGRLLTFGVQIDYWVSPVVRRFSTVAWVVARWRRRSRRAAYAPDHAGVDRTVEIGASSRHHHRAAGGARLDVAEIERAVVEPDPVHNRVGIAEYDRLTASRRWIR
jgi:hypothetical protein